MVISDHLKGHNRSLLLDNLKSMVYTDMVVYITFELGFFCANIHYGGNNLEHHCVIQSILDTLTVRNI